MLARRRPPRRRGSAKRPPKVEGEWRGGRPFATVGHTGLASVRDWRMMGQGTRFLDDPPCQQAVASSPRHHHRIYQHRILSLRSAFSEATSGSEALEALEVAPCRFTTGLAASLEAHGS